MTSASHVMMKASGDSRSGGGASSAVRTRSRETALSVTEADALRTSGGWGLLFTSALARERPRREFSLGAVCGEATRRCDTDCRSVGGIGAELEALRGESAPSGLGRDEACWQCTPGDARCGGARTDAEVSLSTFSLFCHTYHLTMRWSERRPALLPHAA